MDNPKKMLGDAFDPSGIKQPIQLLAIVLGVIVVALIYATIYLSSIQICLGWFSLISSVCITLIVIYKFLSILKESPWVFHNPRDYGPGEYFDIIKRMTDLEEDISLHSAEATEKSKEIIKEAVSKSALDTNNIDEVVDKITNEFTTTFSEVSSENERRKYLDLGKHFEEFVHNCLVDLNIPVKISPIIESIKPDIRYIRPDFIITKKDGKNIPLEVKFYRKKVVANELPSKLVKQMEKYMESMKTDESIIVISSEVTPKALELFELLSPKNKIHIVIGMTEEKLKSQLADILTK